MPKIEEFWFMMDVF